MGSDKVNSPQDQVVSWCVSGCSEFCVFNKTEGEPNHVILWWVIGSRGKVAVSFGV